MLIFWLQELLRLHKAKVAKISSNLALRLFVWIVSWERYNPQKKVHVVHVVLHQNILLLFD